MKEECKHAFTAVEDADEWMPPLHARIYECCPICDEAVEEDEAVGKEEK